MRVLNLVRYRRMLVILGGLIYLNIYFQFSFGANTTDGWSLIYFLLLNFLWIDLIRVSTERYVRNIDEYINNSY